MKKSTSAAAQPGRKRHDKLKAYRGKDETVVSIAWIANRGEDDL